MVATVYRQQKYMSTYFHSMIVILNNYFKAVEIISDGKMYCSSFLKVTRANSFLLQLVDIGQR